MKTYNSYLKYLLTALIIVFSISCSEDFLNRPPEDSITLDNFYQTDAQVNASTSALYGWPWFELNDKAHWTIGDALAGNLWTNDGQMGQFFVFGVTQNNAHMNEAWNSLFRVIAHSNSVINNIPVKSGAGVSEALKTRVIAEARFMRATAYFYLVQLWGPVPIIENNSAIVFDAKVPKNPETDVYRFIIEDLEFCKDNLPVSYSGADAGRVTKWSAMGMLAKVYLAKSGLGQSGARVQADLDMAKEIAGEIINTSGLQLMANYEDLFKSDNENNAESLFAFQWVACQSWGTQNTNQAYWAPTSRLTGVGDGWGGYLGPTIDLQNEFETGDLRAKATMMQDGNFYPELLQAEGGFHYVVADGDDFGESATFAGIKKYVIGTPEDNGGQICFMSTGLNTYMLRLADVYLIYAEAILGNNTSTSDADATGALNAIRNRAGLSPKSTITLDDILHERRVEFAFEAQYWYDMVRLHYWNPSKAIDMISNQERGTYTWETGVKTLNSVKYTITEADFRMPIPSAESDKNPLLLQDPVPYNFGK